MKPLKILTLATCWLGLAPAAAWAGELSLPGRGTDILHYSVKAVMVNDGVLPAASGRVDARYSHQGKVTVQMLGITVRKLAPSTTYNVVIPADPTDPLSEPEVVASFETNRRGNANVRFRNVRHDNGNAMSIGRGRLPLPEALDPLTGVGKLAVTDVEGVSLLSADLAEPTRFSYLVKRDVSTDTVPASVRIVANTTAAYLRLYVLGLEAETDYRLVLNSPETAEVFTTDALGRLVIRSRFENPLEILNLHQLELRDGSDGVVFSASLP